MTDATGDDWTRPLTVEEMYGDWDIEWDDVVAITDRTLGPRNRDSLYDTVARAGVAPGHKVLDIGGRDGRDALAIARRFGCHVTVVDPVELNISDALEAIGGGDEQELVDARIGSITAIPADDGMFDLVLSRDMMSHVGDLHEALAECVRVLGENGTMIVHQVFGTPALDSDEARAFAADLATVEERLSVPVFESTVAEAGFTIAERDIVGSEWLETLLEQEDGERRLLRAARMNRARDAMVAEMGVIPFRVMRANNLWTIYRMIGKLEERIYTLTLGDS
jgi:cyclopropane fatty-acyl-phospholipid synthase-like methyltransferase